MKRRQPPGGPGIVVRGLSPQLSACAFTEGLETIVIRMLRPKRAVDECLLLSELLPRHAFKGELAELSGLLSWVEWGAPSRGAGLSLSADVHPNERAQ